MRRLFLPLLLLLGCNEIDIPDDIGLAGIPSEEPFINLADFATESISTNIPSLQVSVNGSVITALISVTDQDGNPLEGFTIGNYVIQEVIEEDTVQISAQLIENIQETDPLAVSINMDYSGSMSFQDITQMENAIRSFIRLKETQDIFSIIKFASTVDLVQTFTADTSQLINAVNAPENVSGGTSFYDACQQGLEDLNGINGDFIRVVVGFTDGEDSGFGLTLDGLINNATSANIPIYTIGLGAANTAVLSRLSNNTGGRFSLATNNSDIQQLYDQLDNQLNSLYQVQWANSSSAGTVVTVVITVEYTSANGTFVDIATSSYVAP